MVKKFSYLVSVSVLASSLLSSTSHALFDRELREHIDEFQASQSRVVHPSAPAPSPASSSSDEEPSTWWNTAYSVGETLLSATCHSLRYAGDCVRGGSPTSDLLVNNGLSYAGTVTYHGMSAGHITSSLKDNPSAFEYIRKTAGNSLRRLGELGVGETPTLARAIREFWVHKGVTDKPESIFPSTARALYFTRGLSLEEINYHFDKFTVGWNNSSQTNSSCDAGKKVEYLLQGIMRGLVLDNKDFDHIAPQITTLGILEVGTDQARLDAFMSFARSIYTLESQVEHGEQNRQLQLAPSADSVPSALPTPEPHSSGDRNE